MGAIAKDLSKIAGLAATALTIIPGGQPFAAAAGALSSGLGAIAQLTAPPPLPPSQLEDVLLGADQPMPYAVGRCELTGNLVHAEAHGREREDVPNPWRTDTIVLTNGGPVVAIDQLYANKNPIAFGTDGWETGYYEKYLRGDTQIGATPEAGKLDWTALDSGSPPVFSQWTGDRTLSGYAAMQFGMLLDSEETHFRNGPPKFTAVGRWTRHYDPRLDDTQPGGSGAHRLGVESTYEYSVNGVIHALTYLYGRYQNGRLVLGGGLSVTALDIPSFIAAANVADANGWSCHGVVHENGEDGEIWNNVELMLQTAGAWLTNDGGVLRVLQRRPVVTLDTITKADLTGPYSLRGMKSVKDGFNTVIPTIMSEANQWTRVPLSAVGVPLLVALQGEERSKARDYTLVTNASQASALAVLDIYDSVELDPIELTVSRRFIGYDVGDGFTADLPELGLIGTVVMLSKRIDLATGNVIMGLKTDTDGKHAFALGQTSTAPPQPQLVTNEEIETAAGALGIARLRGPAIVASYVTAMNGQITQTEEADGTWTITVPTHTRVYGSPEIFPEVVVQQSVITGLAADTLYYVAYDDPALEGGAVNMLALTNPTGAAISGTNPFRHRIANVTTPSAGSTTGGGAQPTRPPGTNPGDPNDDDFYTN